MHDVEAGADETRRTDHGVAVGEDPDDVGAADPTVAVSLPRLVGSSSDALEVRADAVKPLTSSQTAKTISWVAIGRIRTV
jgi:hypothetical protein